MVPNTERIQVLDRDMHKRRPLVGAIPGTLALPHGAVFPQIRLFTFDSATIEETIVEHPDELRAHIARDRVVWVDVHGLGDEATLFALADVFSIHLLALEDIVHVPQRPKVEIFEKHLLLFLRMLTGGEDGRVEVEQVSMLLGKNYVLTFQERTGDVLETVRERLRTARGKIRARGADYLFYALLDTVVDAYFPVIERVGDCIDDIEIAVFQGRSTRVLESLTDLRATLLSVRRSIWPLRDAVNQLIRDQPPQLSQNVLVYMRDVHDHCINASEMVESYRELGNGLLNTHLSVVSHKMNEIMKVLTIVSTIFIPLTFLSGLYGMNFDHMPELRWRWSYYVVLGVMLLVSVGLLRYFFRQGWIGKVDKNE